MNTGTKKKDVMKDESVNTKLIKSSCKRLFPSYLFSTFPFFLACVYFVNVMLTACFPEENLFQCFIFIG